MESVLPTLEVERVPPRVYATRDEACRDVFGSIEAFHDPRPLHSALGYRSPHDMERMAAKPPSTKPGEDQTRLVVSDAHEGPKAAITRTMAGAA